MYYPFETQVTPLTSVRRDRMLPIPGEVLVGLGERVEPMQTIARAEMRGEFRVVPVARLLSVPASKINGCLRVGVGDEVRRGQVVAQRGVRFVNARAVRSPIDGVMVASGGGRILIESQPTLFELRAYVYGTVTNVMQSRGVVIETTGSVIQGLWGAGGEGFGVLKCMFDSPDRPLQAADIDAACHGTVLVCGVGPSQAALERAEELQVRGIVTGGLQPEMISLVRRLPFPTIVTEGIGTVPMSAPVFRLLKTNDGREASISGQVKPRWGVVRPEVIVFLPAETVPAAGTQARAPLTVGARVRLVRAPYTGRVGTVVAIDVHPRGTNVEAGMSGAEVDVGQGNRVFIPLVNLEVLR